VYPSFHSALAVYSFEFDKLQIRMQQGRIIVLFALIVIYFGSICFGAPDPTKSTVAKQGNGFQIVARKSDGVAVTTGGDNFVAIVVKDTILQYANHADASDTYPGYDPSKVTGPPDAPSCGDDDTTAWCQANYGTYSWLSLNYTTPVLPISLTFYEPYSSGTPCVVGITLSGNEMDINVTGFTDDASCSSTIEPSIAALDYNWIISNVTLDIYNPSSYGEIDAVGLLGAPATFLTVVDNNDGTYFVDTSSLTTEYVKIYVSLGTTGISGSPATLVSGPGSKCELAINVTTASVTTGDISSGQQSDTIATSGGCNSLYTNNTGVWYTVNGTGNIIEVSTCGNSGIKTGISIFSGSCGTGLTCVAKSYDSNKCNCQDSGKTGDLVEFNSVMGQTYLIFIQKLKTTALASFSLSIRETSHTIPANDVCTSATSLASGQTVNATIKDSTPDTFATCGGSNSTSNGVWFAFSGNNKNMVFSTCSTEFDHNIYIYTGSCSSLCPAQALIVPCDSTVSTYGYVITLPAVQGSTYHVLVSNKTCVRERPRIQASLNPAPECFFAQIQFAGFPLTPSRIDEDSCTFDTPASTYDSINTLTFDPSTIYNSSIADIDIKNLCSVLLYTSPRSVVATPFVSYNGFSIDIVRNNPDIGKSVANFKASITTKPFSKTNPVRAPGLHGWGQFSVKNMGCNASDILGFQESYITVDKQVDHLYIYQFTGGGYLSFNYYIFDLRKEAFTIDGTLDVASGTQLPDSSYGEFTFFTYKDNVYVFGGSYVSGSSRETVGGIDSVFKLNAEDDSLVKIPMTGSITGRAGASAVVYNNTIVIFGGMYYRPETYTSIISVIDMSSDLVVARETTNMKGIQPYARESHSAVVYGDCMYVFGGFNFAVTPIYFGDFWKYNFTSSTWTLLNNSTSKSKRDVFPSPRLLHIAQVYKDCMILYGGLFEQEPVYDMWLYNFTSSTWTQLPVGGQAPIMYNAVAAVVGGVINTISQSYNNGLPRVPIMQYTLEDICLSNTKNGSCNPCGSGYYTRDSFMGGVCFPCQVGSYSDQPTAGSCTLCPPGMYQDKSIQTSCSYCPAGFFSNTTGATTLTACLPCPVGTYSGNPGSVSCDACPSDGFCPLATILALDTNQYSDFVLSSEAAFQAEDNLRYKEIDYRLLWIIAGFFFLWVIFILVVLVIRKFNIKKPYYKVLQADVLNVTKYEIPGPVLQTKSIMGGMISTLALLIIVGLLIYVAVTYRLNNDMITVGLVAGLSRTTDVISKYLNVTVALVGFSGQCEYQPIPGEPPLEGICAPGISIDQSGFSDLGGVSCHTVDKSTCLMTWTVGAGNKIQNPSSVTFDVFTQPSSTFAMLWNVTANSVYDGRHTYVSGNTFPDDVSSNSVFRGNRDDPGSLVQLSLIPTTLSFWNKKSNDRSGLTLNFLSRGTGHQVNSTTFYSGGQDSGFTITFDFEIPQFTYQKIVNQRQTAFAMVSMYIALVGGVFSVSRILLTIYFNFKHVAKHNMSRSNSTNTANITASSSPHPMNVELAVHSNYSN